MSEEDVACNYASLQDHGKRIKELEKQIKNLIIRNDILWDRKREREQSQ